MTAVTLIKISIADDARRLEEGKFRKLTEMSERKRINRNAILILK